MSDTVLHFPACIISFSSPSNPIYIICHIAEEDVEAQMYDTCGGYIASKQRSLGLPVSRAEVLTPPPRLLLLI